MATSRGATTCPNHPLCPTRVCPKFPRFNRLYCFNIVDPSRDNHTYLVVWFPFNESMQQQIRMEHQMDGKNWFTISKDGIQSKKIKGSAPQFAGKSFWNDFAFESSQFFFYVLIQPNNRRLQPNAAKKRRNWLVLENPPRWNVKNIVHGLAAVWPLPLPASKNSLTAEHTRQKRPLFLTSRPRKKKERLFA